MSALIPNRPDPVPEIPPLDPELLEEILSLSDAAEAILKRRPRAGKKEFAPLAERRRALLARHLGRDPGADIEPIHCFGDSNTMFFAGSERLKFIRYRRLGLWRPRWINRGLDLLPVFRAYHVGPTTAWKFPEYGSTTRAREKLELILRKEINPPARILLSVGEIDCRIHMAKTILEGKKTIWGRGTATAEKFLSLPLWLREQGYRPIVWGPPQIVPKDERYNSPTFPFIGPLEHRRDITLAYIATLEEKCAAHGIPCVCLVGHFHPMMERLPMKFFHDNAHLSQCLMPLALRLLSEAGILTSHDMAPRSELPEPA